MLLRTKEIRSLSCALLAATCLTPPSLVQAAPGDALGPEFQVNTFKPDIQARPSVAIDTDGDFVVAWESYYQEAPIYAAAGVFAQRFDAAGVAQGPEFLVNNVTTFHQAFQSVAMDADGDFVVAWTDYVRHSRDLTPDVFAQRYQGAGPVAGDFTVDGRADILWRNITNGAALVWTMDGLSRRAVSGIGGAPLAWEVQGLGDFNADAKADILWRNTGNGATLVWQMDGFVTKAVGGLGRVPLVWEVQ